MTYDTYLNPDRSAPGEGMIQEQLKFHSGAVVVFEGLDGVGKSTQIEMLKAASAMPSVCFTHMPSGFNSLTKHVYEAMEQHSTTSGLGKQLLHLGCHAESIAPMVEALTNKALVLDRWWWSAVAYGWYGGSIRDSGLSEQNFFELIQTIWAPIVPSVVFLFLNPIHVDANNTDSVQSGYQQLASSHPDLTVIVPALAPAETYSIIVGELVKRRIVEITESEKSER